MFSLSKTISFSTAFRFASTYVSILWMETSEKIVSKRSHSSIVIPWEQPDFVPPKKRKVEPFAIFGLGNPGKEYEGTRHNIGFDCIDKIAHHFNVALNQEKYKCFYGSTMFGDIPIYLCKPQTFMNLSGYSVSNLSTALDIPPKNIVVIYDEISLPLGALRLKTGISSSGGQKGMEDILRKLGNNSKHIKRLKFGVGKPEGDIAKFVLKKFRPDDKSIVEETIKRVVGCVELLIKDGHQAAMTMYNRTFEDFNKEIEKKEKKRIELKHKEKEKEKEKPRKTFDDEFDEDNV